jgi:hypothetical protein
MSAPTGPCRAIAFCFDQHAFGPAERPDYKLVVLTPVAAGNPNR